jgi:regulator of protease activity HflC (stomatin/prohibitin superfamily)
MFRYAVNAANRRRLGAWPLGDTRWLRKRYGKTHQCKRTMKKLTILLIGIAMLVILVLTLKQRHMTHTARNLDTGVSACSTEDAKTLLISVRVGWRITDAWAFSKYFPGGSLKLAQDHVKNMVHHAEMDVIGLHNLSEFVNPEGSEIKNDKIESEIESDTQTKLDMKTGIKIESLVISSVGHH